MASNLNPDLRLALALAMNISERAAKGERPDDPRDRAIFDAFAARLCMMTARLVGGAINSADAPSDVDTDAPSGAATDPPSDVDADAPSDAA